MANIVVSVTLHKDAAKNYSLDISPLTSIVSFRDDEENPVTVNWVLQEDPMNPDFPNAVSLTASFKETASPFNNSGLPENYTTAANSTSGDGEPPTGPAAEVLSPPVRQDAVGTGNAKLYGYTIIVKTKDGKDVILDPHVKVRTQSITRGTNSGY